MSQDSHHSPDQPAPMDQEQGVPRWPATLAFLSIGISYLLVSKRHVFGPPWLPLAVEIVLLIPLWLARYAGLQRLTRSLAFVLTAVTTGGVATSAVLLVIGLPDKKGLDPLLLLRDAALIWLGNIVTFALWYWEIDAGGPAQRRLARHSSEDFVFPQMVVGDKVVEGWSPLFIDYLFLAFNTSTAFSPTDTMVLSRRAKVLMMIQALISLIVVAVLAARAINTL